MARSLGTVNKKYRRLAVTLFTLVVLLILQPFLWRFVHEQALTLQQERSQEQQIANVKERNDEIGRRLETAREFLTQLEAVSPPTADKTKIVERVEQLADQLGLVMDITVIQELQGSDAVASDDHVVPVSMSVSTTGPTRQLLSFFDRVEHTQELSVVPTWTLAPAAGPAAPPGAPVVGGESLPYTLTMDILFFLRRINDGQGH
jgi:hypothetical protein